MTLTVSWCVLVRRLRRPRVSGVRCWLVRGRRGMSTSVFDDDGELTSVTDANGETTRYRYDDGGDRVSTTDPDGNVTSVTYDLDARVTATTVGSGGSASTTSTGYDVAPGSGACQSVAVSVYCQVMTDADGAATVDYYDALGDVVGQSRPGGVITTATFDGAGNRLTKTDAAGAVTTDTYDADNRLTGVAFSDGSTPVCRISTTWMGGARR